MNHFVKWSATFWTIGWFVRWWLTGVLFTQECPQHSCKCFMLMILGVHVELLV